MWGLEPGNAFAGYLIDEFVGRGGMGVVFRAWQPGTNRAVALKVMSPELSGDDAYAALFKREARTAASIHHPHVIDVYDFGEADGLLYLAMRLVEGRDLSKILAAEGALEPSRAAAIVAQAADALHAAHARGLVHRDVKPANLSSPCARPSSTST
jgi:serine/threonine protein kinase